LLRSYARRAAARDALGKLGAFGRQLLQQLPELTVGETTKARTGRVAGPRRRRTAYVTKLSIRNFKIIRKLDLTFEHAPGQPADQTADGSTSTTATRQGGLEGAAGENGTEEYRAQALALALAGDRELAAPPLPTPTSCFAVRVGSCRGHAKDS
jgi:hypothetical protein